MKEILALFMFNVIVMLSSRSPLIKMPELLNSSAEVLSQIKDLGTGVKTG